MKTDSTQDIARRLAMALLESESLSEIESGLQKNGIHLNLPLNPSPEKVESALNSLLEMLPWIIPLDEWRNVSDEGREEWAMEKLNMATASAGDFE